MLELEGYSDITQVFSGKSFALFRGVQRAGDHSSVLIKTFSTDFPRREEYGFLRQDYELAASLQPGPLLAPLEIRQEGRRMYTIWRDTPGVQLKKIITESNTLYLDYGYALRVFSGLARALGALHKKNLVVRGLHPSQLFFDPADGAAQLSGLGFATFTTADMPALAVELYETEDLAYYMAPEQTGRMAAPVDQRTDLYALGVIFFECLTRQLPFPHSDMMGLIHAHLAQEPPDIHLLNPGVPEALTVLVRKLLSKNAADRYQSTRGLLSDLEKCQRRIQEGRSAEPFEPGLDDVSDIFQLPEKTYGRQDALELLSAALERAREKHFEAVFISGPSGMGKSILIREAWARAEKTDLIFLNGTFKNYNKKIPYSGVTEALRGVVNQILTLPEKAAAGWQVRIREALGQQGILMTNIIPELELLVGKQPELSDEAAPEAAENRLQTLFLQLIAALTSTDKNLVLFIDDLHLAEPASVELLQNLLHSREQNKLLLIGTYVESDAVVLEPLLQKAREETQAREIHLTPLSKADIGALLREALQTADGDLNGVVDILYDKTKGIPIFLREFLHRAHREGGLFFDYDRNAWRWDKVRIEQMPISGNVAELVLGKVLQLPEATLRLLQLAACIGVHFDFDTLQELSELTPEDTARHLGFAMQEGFVSLREEPRSLETSSGKWYSFTHDRLQQAVYYQADSDWRARQHFLIGRLLHQHYRADDAVVFTIANQLLDGLSHIAGAGFRSHALTIFFAAGKKAHLAASYLLAYQYFEAARQMLSPEDWQRDYAYTYDLYARLIECAYLAGPPGAGDQLFAEAFPNTKSKLDRANLYMVRMESHIYLSQMRESFEAGQAGLKLLGKGLPENPGRLAVLLEIIRSALSLRGKTRETIIALPEQTDPRARLLENIYFRSLQYAYSFNKELFAIIALRHQQESLRSGLGEYAYSGYSVYASVLTIGFGQYRRGFYYNELALKIAEKNGAPAAVGGSLYGMGLNGVFSQPLPDCLRYFEEAFEQLKRAGDATTANGAAFNVMAYAILLARPMSECREKNAYFRSQAFTIKQALGNEMQAWYAQMLDWLTQTTPEELPDPQALLEEKYPSFTDIYGCLYYIQWMQLYFWLGRIEAALKVSQMAEKLEQVFFFHLMHVDYYYIRALAMTRAYETAERKTQREYARFIRKAGRLLAKRTQYAPDNFQHKYLAVQAALHQIRGDWPAALEAYQSALKSVPPGAYHNDAGVLNELAAHAALRLGRLKNGAVFYDRAREAFERWGANALSRRLKLDYQEILYALGGLGAEELGAPSASGTVDFKAVLKASQLLSGEIDLPELLNDLIRIMLENAGAQRGFLIVEQKGRLVIAAEGDAGRQTVTVHRAKPLEEGELPAAVVQYVARTQKPLALNDAAQDERFAADPYMVESKPRSVLCRPILHQNKLIGILYLENNLAYGAFTYERQEALALLSGQAAISLQNAFLYDQLSALNQAYERFVPKEFLNLLEKESMVDVGLGDHIQREMTVMFADIRQFTALSEQLSPRDNFRFINDYLSVMEPCILRWGGFIDKYIGDAIMALFPGGADDALQAALDMLAQLDVFNQSQEQPVRIGIGLNTGNLILGTVGSAQRMDGTVISDAVNVAARVENLTKRYGAHILITANTFLKLKNPGKYPLRVLDQAEVEGKTERVTLYEVCTGSGVATDALKVRQASDFERAVMLCHSDRHDEAEALFGAILAANPGDQPARVWLERCRAHGR